MLLFTHEDCSLIRNWLIDIIDKKLTTKERNSKLFQCIESQNRYKFLVQTIFLIHYLNEQTN